MPFDLVLKPCTFSILPVARLEKLWANIPGNEVRKAIAYEHQYLQLHVRLMKSLHFTAAGQAQNPNYTKPLDYTLRAGYIKAAILVAASICEAALRAHAERRRLALPSNPKHRTFGKILGAWSGNMDVASIYSDLVALKDFRNNVHLFVAVASPDAAYMSVLKNEKEMLAKARRCISTLIKLASP